MKSLLNLAFEKQTEYQDILRNLKTYKNICGNLAQPTDSLNSEIIAKSRIDLKDQLHITNQNLSKLNEKKIELDAFNTLSINLENIGDIDSKQKILDERKTINMLFNKRQMKLDEELKKLNLMNKEWEDFDLKLEFVGSNYLNIEEKLISLGKMESSSDSQMVDRKNKLQVQPFSFA